MHGKNEVAKSRSLGEGFTVHSIWHTIQGEGPYAGWPAIFVRFSGCNLRCFWCDTDFEQGDKLYLEALARKINQMFRDHPNTKLLVLTGGEPMLQPLRALVEELPDTIELIQVETAGSVWPAGFDFNQMTAKHVDRLRFVVSPKTPHLHPRAITNAYAYKYIIAEGEVGFDGLPVVSTQLAGRSALIFRPPHSSRAPVFVQPRDDGDPVKNAANLRFATKTAMEHGYRLSIQVHKIVGVD